MKMKILPEMCLASEAKVFQKMPRGNVARIAFGIDPVNAFLKRRCNDCRQCFRCVTFSLVILVNDIADFLCGEFTFPAIDIADDLAGRQQFNGNEFLGIQPGMKMFDAVRDSLQIHRLQAATGIQTGHCGQLL